MPDDLEIRIDPHTLERSVERGARVEEIEEVVRTGTPVTAKYGRSARTKTYEFRRLRLGKYYEHKRIVVIYTIEGVTAVTVTVHVFYGRWED